MNTLNTIIDYSKISNFQKLVFNTISFRCVSVDQVSKQKRLFQKLDSQKKKGFILKEEINNLLREYIHDKELIEKVVSSMDFDKDGKIFWNEFLASTL